MTTQRDMLEHQALPDDRRSAAAVSELTAKALSSADLPSLMQETVACVKRALDVEYSAIWEPTPDGRSLILRAGRGRRGDPLGTTIELAAGSELHSLVHGTRTRLDGMRRAEEMPHTQQLDGHAAVSSLSVPVAAGAGAARGVLSALTGAARSFGEHDVVLLQAMANIVALGAARLAAAADEQRLREQTLTIERRRQVAQSLHEILTILNSSHTLDGLMAYLIAQACRLLGAEAGAIYRLHNTGRLLVAQASWGIGAAELDVDVPLERGAAGEAVRTRSPVHYAFDKPNSRDGRRDGSSDGSAPKLYGLLAVPLIIKGEVYGALALYDERQRAVSEEDIALASTLGDHAALAIENARLVAAAQDKAVLEERQRLARDLHDSVTQALYGVTLHAQAARRLLESANVTTAADSLRALQDTAQEALDEMRLLIYELRPPILDQAGLVAALQARLQAVEGRVNLKTSLLAGQLGVLPPATEHALYRIAQEALNNALKHAHASSINVRLSRSQSSVVLEVIDDGIGFSPAAETGGLGLRGIRERVSQLNGRCDIRSLPASGTTMYVEIGL